MEFEKIQLSTTYGVFGEIIAYAGVGSRDISEAERRLIERIAKYLKKYFVVYSGNAHGADVAFQTGSEGNCVIMLPWTKFNADEYDRTKSLAWFSKGKSPEGIMATMEFHPVFTKLSEAEKEKMTPEELKALLDPGSWLYMARNYHQIMGEGKYPKVKFVICCGDILKNGDVKGGTGQAVRIARSMGIPVINLRDPNWKDMFISVVESLGVESASMFLGEQTT